VYVQQPVKSLADLDQFCTPDGSSSSFGHSIMNHHAIGTCKDRSPTHGCAGCTAKQLPCSKGGWQNSKAGSDMNIFGVRAPASEATRHGWRGLSFFAVLNAMRSFVVCVLGTGPAFLPHTAHVACRFQTMVGWLLGPGRVHGGRKENVK